MPVFLGFEEPQQATREQMATAIMFGKFLYRDDEGVAYEYQGNVYFLPKADTKPEATAPAKQTVK